MRAELCIRSCNVTLIKTEDYSGPFIARPWELADSASALIAIP